MTAFRNRRWRLHADEATRLAAAGTPRAEIARRLSVDRSTVNRWIRSGKLQDPALVQRPPRDAARRPRHGGRFETWARKKYNFTRAELETVKCIQAALDVRDDKGSTTSERLQACALAARLLRELQLPKEDFEDGDAEETGAVTPLPFPRKVG